MGSRSSVFVFIWAISLHLVATAAAINTTDASVNNVTFGDTSNDVINSTTFSGKPSYTR